MVEAQTFEHPGDRPAALRAANAGHPQAVAEVVFHGIIEHIRVLVQVHHVAAQPPARRLPGLAAPIQRDLATVGRLQPGENLQQRRLAGTVAAGEMHDPAGFQHQPAD